MGGTLASVSSSVRFGLDAAARNAFLVCPHRETGRASGTPMQVSSSGSADLLSLVMFLVDADQPFLSPETFP
jgi:hypothetical protein